MALQWKDNLATGVRTIDSQHKELFNYINNLLEAMGKGKGEQEINKTMSFLQKYTTTHFGNEEKYMNQHRYPDYKNHKSYHESYKKDFDNLKKKILSQGAGTATTLEIQKFLSDWWINHINNVDKKLGAFLKDKV